MVRGKLKFAAGLMLVALVFAAIGVIAVLRYFDFVTETSNAPYNYPDTDWVCEEPYIKYHIPADLTEETAVAVATVDGRDVRFVIDPKSSEAAAREYVTDSEGKYDPDGAKTLFTGEISYSKDSFTFKIDRESDVLFGGKYDSLVFNRVGS